jgi:hypothetical protein
MWRKSDINCWQIKHLSWSDPFGATQTVFPGTELRIVYELVSAQNPRVQEV